MDWSYTNGNNSGSVADRPVADYRTYTIKGAPIETIIDLINQLGSDMWLSIPHLADN